MYLGVTNLPLLVSFVKAVAFLTICDICILYQNEQNLNQRIISNSVTFCYWTVKVTKVVGILAQFDSVPLIILVRCCFCFHNDKTSFKLVFFDNRRRRGKAVSCSWALRVHSFPLAIFSLWKWGQKINFFLEAKSEIFHARFNKNVTYC